MDSRLHSSPKSREPVWPLLISGLWVVAFLWLFFDHPLPDSEEPRWKIWLLMADEILGISSSEVSTTPSGIQFLSQRIPLFGWALLILALAVTHGFGVCRLVLPQLRLLRSERIVLCFGTGLPVLSLVTLCCGLAGQLNVTCIATPSVATLFFALLRSRRKPAATDDHRAAIASGRSSRVLVGMSLLVVIPFVVYLLLGSVSPPTDFDVREYHLQGPKEWFQQGRISFLPHNVYTSFPFLSEMLSLTGMVFTGDWWRGALVGKAILACFQLLSALAVFAVARRWISSSVAWLAVLIYLTTPWTLRISMIAYAEGSLTFFLIASTMAALLARVRPRDSWRVAVLCGLLAGSAMASKYTGLITVIMPTALVLALALWPKFRTETAPPGSGSLRSFWKIIRWRPLYSIAGSYGLGIVLMVSPWLLRNLYDTGNPVYPLGYSVFGGNEWSAQINARWKTAHEPSERSLQEIPRHLLGAAVWNTWTSALLFSLAIPSVLLWRRNRILAIILSLIAWVFFTWWAMTHRIDRFWIPVIPLLSVAAASSWLLSQAVVWRAFITTVIIAVTIFNIRFCGLPAVGFHVGLMDLDAARQLVIRSDIRTLNRSMPENAKVLIVGEAEVFDATFPLVYNTVFDECLFEEWTSDPKDAALPAKQRRMLPPDAIRSVLKARGITHILVHWGEILRYRLPGSYGYADFVQPSRFRTLAAQNILTPPRTLLARPWSSLSDSEQAIIKSWDGYQDLLPNKETLITSQLFTVAVEAQ